MTLKVEGLNALVRDLQALGAELDDIKDVFADIAQQGADMASGFAPKRTGRLAASIKGNRAKNKAMIKAGGAKVPYAAPINYGWKARNIEPAHFLQKVDETLGPRVPSMLEQRINELIREKGLK